MLVFLLYSSSDGDLRSLDTDHHQLNWIKRPEHHQLKGPNYHYSINPAITAMIGHTEDPLWIKTLPINMPE